jgi:hypothetical protein
VHGDEIALLGCLPGVLRPGRVDEPDRERVYLVVTRVPGIRDLKMQMNLGSLTRTSHTRYPLTLLHVLPYVDADASESKMRIVRILAVRMLYDDVIAAGYFGGVRAWLEEVGKLPL